MSLMLILGRKLELLENSAQRTEADYRLELIAVRHHAEQIALANSEDVHTERIFSRFERVRRLTWEIMFLNKKMGFTFKLFNEGRESSLSCFLDQPSCKVRS